MKRLIGILASLLLICLMSSNTFAQAELDELNQKYMTVKDNQNHIITQIGHQLTIGDEYLTSDNRLYQVNRISGQTAWVTLVKKNGLAEDPWNTFKTFVNEVFNLDFLHAEVKQRGPIAIYHTHSDESYVPSDGTSSKVAHGGIFQVGDTLTKALERRGIPVIHSKTPHDPHDGMAYDRSRRTAVQLLRHTPSCLIDMHRDAGPREPYSEFINKRAVTKVQLVIGRQNPHFQANNDFAKRIKAIADKKYPGFIKGIFYGKGKFNQDLGPRAILLEFGTEENTKQAAERGADVFAAATSNVIYGAAGSGMVNRGSWRSLFWIIVALVGGVGLFLLINRSNLKDVRKEFTGAIGENNPEETDESEQDKPGNN